MDFTNQQIEPGSLPKLEETSFLPLEPEYLTTQRIAVGLSTFIIVVIAAALYFLVDEVKESIWFYIIFGTTLLMLMTIYIGNVVSFSQKGYAIREKDVIYRSGWLVKRTRVIPLNRVQHVSVQSGPIERRYGLGSVSLYTAGSDDADCSIRGLKQETANQIKEWISSQLYDNAPIS